MFICLVKCPSYPKYRIPQYVSHYNPGPSSLVNGGLAVSEILGPFSSADVASDCAAGGLLKEPLLWVISYALMAVCAVVLLILLLLLSCRHRDRSREITDESSLVRHRIKWLRRASGDTTAATGSPSSTEAGKGEGLGLHWPIGLFSGHIMGGIN